MKKGEITPIVNMSAGAFKRLIRVLASLKDEALITLSNPSGIMGDGQLNAKVVDPAHVAMVVVEYTKFIQVFQADSIALDLDRLKWLAKKLPITDSVTIGRMADSKKMTFQWENIMVVMPEPDPMGFSNPKYPKLNFTHEFTANTRRMREALRNAEQCGNGVTFERLADGGLEASATENPAKDEPPEWNIYMRVLKEGTLPEPPLKSHFSTDYLINILRVLPATATYRMAMHYPIEIEVENDYGLEKFVVAPRILTD